MSRRRCVVCQASCRGLAFCPGCARSLDRSTSRDDGTLLAVITWAAKRARTTLRRQRGRS